MGEANTKIEGTFAMRALTWGGKVLEGFFAPKLKSLFTWARAPWSDGQWCANPNPYLIWLRFKSNLCLMDSDLDSDLRYFEKGGFDLDMVSWIWMDLWIWMSGFKSGFGFEEKNCPWIWFGFGFEQSYWIWIWFGFARMVDLHTTADGGGHGLLSLPVGSAPDHPWQMNPGLLKTED